MDNPNSRTCPKCKKIFSWDSMHCPFDGERLLTWICNKCKAEYSLEMKFCSIDGNPLDFDVVSEKEKVLLDLSLGHLKTFRLIITNTKLSYLRKEIMLSDINRIRWGAFLYYVNAIRHDRKYTIWVSDQKNTIKIECGQIVQFEKNIVEKYEQILDVLWKKVCIRIINNMFDSIESGKEIQVGDVLIKRDGIFLPLKGVFFKTGKHEFHPWRQIAYHSKEGRLIISSKANQNAITKLSYRDVDNVHLLKVLMDHAR